MSVGPVAGPKSPSIDQLSIWTFLRLINRNVRSLRTGFQLAVLIDHSAGPKNSCAQQGKVHETGSLFG